MSDSNLFKPTTSTSGIGKKAMSKGQFQMAPAYPEVSGFSGPSAIKGSEALAGTVQKSPSAKSGRV